MKVIKHTYPDGDYAYQWVDFTEAEWNEVQSLPGDQGRFYVDEMAEIVHTEDHA